MSDKTENTKADSAVNAAKTEKVRDKVGKVAILGRNRGAVLRLQQDYINLNKDPVPYIRAEPLSSNILEWHYVIRGPENTPYHGGFYHGCLVFTQQYPFRPPSISMRTPNGRFQTNRRLCLSISDYHPDEWNPAWSVSSILTGLLSFMLEDGAALGTIITLPREKQQFAFDSLQFNLQDKTFQSLFPDICEEMTQLLEERAKNQIKGPMSAENDERSLALQRLRTGNFSVGQNNNDGYPHMILIILCCLVALILHHAYSVDPFNIA